MDIAKILDDLVDADGNKTEVKSGNFVVWNAADAVIRIADRFGNTVYFGTPMRRDDKFMIKGIDDKEMFVEEVLITIAKIHGLGWTEQKRTKRDRNPDIIAFRLV